MDLPARDLVLANLPRGRDAAVSIGALAERLKLARRTVEQSCQSIAADGIWPLVAGNEGVWIATSSVEVDAYLASLRHRALEILRRYAAVKEAGRRMEGTQQLPLFKEGEAA